MRKRGRFDFVELATAMAVTALVTFLAVKANAPAISPFVPRAAGQDLERLAKRFGPERFSEHAEEWIVRDFFQDRRAGFFVDVGAYDFRRLSNTYYLETSLDWSGIAIEPQAKFAAGYADNRPRTTFVPLFISDHSDVDVTMHVPASADTVASADKSFAESYAAASPMVVRTVTLDDLLARLQVKAIDFLTMDIELSEPAALRGFSIERFMPSLVCVEAHPEVRQEILDYFATHGYTLVGAYLRADNSNLWFKPLTN